MAESEAAYAAREAERETWRAARRELAAALGCDPGLTWMLLLAVARQRSPIERNDPPYTADGQPGIFTDRP
jgi:hypothetical protein